MTIRVLFVCLGNICRSPMAEAVFAHKVREAGLSERIEADSAGTGSWHVGERPHSGTRRVLAANNISYDHCARTLFPSDLNDFDYIITMDETNLRDVLRMGRGRARVAPLMSYAANSGWIEVPDPYYTGRFDEVYHLVDQATEGLLAMIRREHEI
ncbi:MAG TPA: low molecular weight protein-tyrosine-phosphatase [Capsulimonadaceae bacterium]|nr:low molecular weight protein-tyrosine-phosphatase [Capsulimonadaceae bacterium]